MKVDYVSLEAREVFSGTSLNLFCCMTGLTVSQVQRSLHTVGPLCDCLIRFHLRLILQKDGIFGKLLIALLTYITGHDVCIFIVMRSNPIIKFDPLTTIWIVHCHDFVRWKYFILFFIVEVSSFHVLTLFCYNLSLIHI